MGVQLLLRGGQQQQLTGDIRGGAAPAGREGGGGARADDSADATAGGGGGGKQEEAEAESRPHHDGILLTVRGLEAVGEGCGWVRWPRMRCTRAAHVSNGVARSTGLALAKACKQRGRDEEMSSSGSNQPLKPTLQQEMEGAAGMWWCSQ